MYSQWGYHILKTASYEELPKKENLRSKWPNTLSEVIKIFGQVSWWCYERDSLWEKWRHEESMVDVPHLEENCQGGMKAEGIEKLKETSRAKDPHWVPSRMSKTHTQTHPRKPSEPTA